MHSVSNELAEAVPKEFSSSNLDLQKKPVSEVISEW